MYSRDTKVKDALDAAWRAVAAVRDENFFIGRHMLELVGYALLRLRVCDECNFTWESNKNKEDEKPEEIVCPNCKAELEEEKATNLGRAVNKMDRRIKFLERQVEGLEQRVKNGK